MHQSTDSFDADRLRRLDEVVAAHVARGGAGAAVWGLARHGRVHQGSAGSFGPGGPALGPDTIFRLSSTSKPIVAAAAVALLEQARLRLDDPVDELLPELADRRVLARPGAALDDVVPARRPITVRDVITFRLGHGWDFATAGPQPVAEAAAALGLGAGPPAPAALPDPDEFMRRLGTLPLAFQPGERWLYHAGANVLGVLIARAAGSSLPEALRELVLDPAGMPDTGFSVPAPSMDRFGPCHVWSPDGGRQLYDPADGQWATPPAFPGGGDGLVSTLADVLAFGSALIDGGRGRHGRVLGPSAVEAMTTDQLTHEQRTTAGPDPDGAMGWGLGVGVQVRRDGLGRDVGSYGWDGGLGTTWTNDPRHGLVGVLLTDQAWASPEVPPLFRDFWTCAYAALA